MSDLGWELDEDKDEGRTREFNYAGRDFKLTARDPHGFVKVSLPKGPAPKSLSGEFTSFYEAEKHIIAHLTQKPEKTKTKVSTGGKTASDIV